MKANEENETGFQTQPYIKCKTKTKHKLLVGTLTQRKFRNSVSLFYSTIVYSSDC